MDGDLQSPDQEYETDEVYAPVVTHETLRNLLAIGFTKNLLSEGTNDNNAYLYDRLDVPIIVKQPANASKKLVEPRSVCQLQMSMYGSNNAQMLWGLVIKADAKQCGLQVSDFDARLYFKRASSFIII